MTLKRKRYGSHITRNPRSSPVVLFAGAVVASSSSLLLPSYQGVVDRYYEEVDHAAPVLDKSNSIPLLAAKACIYRSLPDIAGYHPSYFEFGKKTLD